jgi:hypothetical protein
VYPDHPYRFTADAIERPARAPLIDKRQQAFLAAPCYRFSGYANQSAQARRRPIRTARQQRIFPDLRRDLAARVNGSSIRRVHKAPHGQPAIITPNKRGMTHDTSSLSIGRAENHARHSATSPCKSTSPMLTAPTHAKRINVASAFISAPFAPKTE